MVSATRRCDIAIVGMSCRFAGGGNSPEAFWDFLEAGGQGIGPIRPERWDVSQFSHPDAATPGRSYATRAGMLEDVAGFDAGFFGISPREAEQMDPQQRLLLEMAWEAFERAGIPPEHPSARDCAVYVGVSSTDYADIRIGDPAGGNAYFMLGSTLSIVANRLSYVFDLHGPSMAVDTACSSTLVALNEAVHALLDGRANMALVGGIHMLLSPYPFIGFSRAQMLSDYGQCRAFAKLAKGYVRAEGGGVLLLKPLAQAEADGDPILAVIRGSGTNNDGRTVGIALPSSEQQENLLRQVYGRFGLDPADLAYVEAHGTGTAVGDPAEAGSIGRALARCRPAGEPLPIGSVKSNIGHLEPASGMAGMIKAIGILNRGVIPPSLHAEELNPAIPFAELNVEVVREKRRLPDSPKPALIGVNSFGFGGANAHVVLQQYRANRAAGEDRPDAKVQAERVKDKAEALLLPVSARTPTALRSAAGRLADFIDASKEPLFDIAYTAACRRSHLEHRLLLRGNDRAEIIRNLRRFADGAAVDTVITSGAVVARQPKVAFVFSGNGAQWIGMGVQLLARDAVFAAAVRRVDAIVKAKRGWSVIQELQAPAAQSRIALTEYAQPLLFAIQVGLVEALAARGLTADGVIGHSVGEIAAAWAAGALDLEQAVHVILERSAAQEKTRGLGRMAAAGIDADRAALEIARYNGAIELAAINSQQAVTLSGDAEALIELGEKLKLEGKHYQILDLDYAFHNRCLEPVRDGLQAALHGLQPADGRLPFYSTVAGAKRPGSELTAGYWWRNVRQPVLFEPAMSQMIADGYGIFVEIGAHPIMQAYIRHSLRAANAPGQPLSVMTRQDAEGGVQQLNQAVARAYCLGAPIDWSRYFSKPGRCVQLPHYPWERERYWFPVTSEARGPLYARSQGSLIGSRIDNTVPIWENLIDTACFPFLADHVVGESVVFPAAAFLELVLQASRALFNRTQHDISLLQIQRPMMLEAGQAKMVRVIAEGSRIRIESRTRLSEDPWTLHAVASINESCGHLPALPALEDVARASRLSADDHYQIADAIGLHYGPAFRPVRSALVHGRSGEAELAPAEQPFTFELSPIALDGALQVLFDIMRKQAADEAAVAFLPYQVERVIVVKPQAAVSRCRILLTRRSARSLMADFDLLDAEGAVVASLRGFRFQRADILRSQRDLKHRYESIFVPLDLAGQQRELPPAAELIRAASDADAMPELDAIAARLAAATLQKAASQGILRADSFGLDHGRRLGRILSNLAAFGYATAAPEGWRLAPMEAVDWQQLLGQHPDLLQELLLLGRGLLTLGETAPSAASEPPLKLLDGSASAALADAALASVLCEAQKALPAWQRLRLLEIRDRPGASTYGLDRDRLSHTLLVADADGAAEADAEVIEAELDGMLASLDGLRGRSFDVVLLRHPAWLSKDLSHLLSEAAQLLAPGGRLVLVSYSAGLWLELALNESALPDAAQWSHLLSQAGLAQPQTHKLGPCLVAVGEATAAVKPVPAAKSRSATHWLIVGGSDPAEDDLAHELAIHLVNAGDSVLLAREAEAYVRGELEIGLPYDDPSAWRTALEDIAASEAAAFGIIYLNRLTSTPDATAEIAAQTWPLAALMQTHQQMSATKRFKLVLVSAGAQPLPAALGQAGAHVAPGQAALWGLGRVLANEHPDLQVRLIDLHAPAAMLSRLAPSLAAEILGEEQEDEVVRGSDRRFALRLRPAAASLPAAEQDRWTQRLIAPGGSLTGLQWQPVPRRAPGRGEVEIRVEATGLNFRDVMYSLGVLPDEAVENGFAGATIGMEAAGVVTAVGKGVRDFAEGDAVFFFGPACFAGHVTVKTTAVARRPAGMSAAAAATIPTVFFTVIYVLNELAKLRRGERILIHGAAGGVGLAAIQYARHIGAEIFATVGSPEKRDLLRLLGLPEDRIFDSRALSFADDIRAATGGEGVDVVLNSLAGPAIEKGLEALRPFGRFVELGKRDFFANTSIGLRPFRNNISYFGVDADQLLQLRPALAARIFRQMVALFEQGKLQPLPYRLFKADDAIDAFRLMQQGRHIGKIVVRPPLLKPQASSSDGRLDPAAWYVVFGGTSGFGLASAEWLLEQGAKKLALVGRSGKADEAIRQLQLRAKRRGAEVVARGCDVTDRAALQQLVAELCADGMPIRGAIHAATIYDDAVLTSMSRQQFCRVIATKAEGGFAIAAALAGQPLDFLLLYSSVTVALGNPGQANYVAANAVLEAMAAADRVRGGPALAVAWGAIADVGYLARRSELQQAIVDRLGTAALSSKAALRELGGLLAAPVDSRRSHMILAPIDWTSPALRTAMGLNRHARFSDLLGPADASEGSDAEDFRSQIADLTAEEVHVLVADLLAEQIGQVLRVSADKIDRHRPLSELGMDSLTALELRMMVEQKFGFELPVMMIGEGANLTKVAERICSHLLNATPANGEDDMIATIAARHAEPVAMEDARQIRKDMERNTSTSGQTLIS